MSLNEEKKQLQDLVDSCKSYSEILRRLGKANSGSALKSLKEKLDNFGIKHNLVYEKEISKQIDLKDILKKNRPYNSNTLRKRLIEEGLKKNSCENPGCPCQNSTWLGKEITLHLDHINGDHNDNRLENLRILCPNCHSQTPTYGAKSRIGRKTCPDCGKIINNKSSYCTSCSPKHRKIVSIKNKPTKDTLLKLLETKTFCEIGRLYNVSDSAVRKWCKKYDIPNTKEKLKEFFKNKNHNKEK